MSGLMAQSGETWFGRRRFHRLVPSRLRLVCFPHAGGAASLFRDWPNHLPPDVEMLPVHYPGRQSRLTEPCIETMDELADRITDALTPFLDRPLAMFGHSMGAVAAYEVAVRLEARHDVTPARLFISGRPAPHRTRPTDLHDVADETLIAAVRRLGDLHSAVFDDPDLRELLLPALRGDFRLIESYRPERLVPVSAPISVCVGDSDPGCQVADIRAWSDLTTGGFDLRTFPGDHFYLGPREAELVGHLARSLAAVRPPSPGL